MKFASVIMFLVSILFAVSVLADEQSQQQVISNNQDLDSAISENWHQVKVGGAYLLGEVYASLVIERLQLKEKLDADPNNRKLRAKYESALASEKKSLELTKQFISDIE